MQFPELQKAPFFIAGDSYAGQTHTRLFLLTYGVTSQSHLEEVYSNTGIEDYLLSCDALELSWQQTMNSWMTYPVRKPDFAGGVGINVQAIDH